MEQGIDVSVYQGLINWAKVARDGIKFAMIKATQGRGETVKTENLRHFTDTYFVRNVLNSTLNSINIGVYHYLTAQTEEEAVEEAEYFVSVISAYRSYITMWAAVDVESEVYLKDIPRDKLTRIVNAFLEVVAKNGFKPMLYTNPNFLKYRYDEKGFPGIPIWLAHYRTTKPSNVDNMLIWQYGSGVINGISGKVSLNRLYTDKAYLVGDFYEIKPGDIYSNNLPVPERLFGEKIPILKVTPTRILLDGIFSWVKTGTANDKTT